MDRDLGFQFIEELTALPTPLLRIGAIDAVTEFRHCQCTDDDGNVACGFADFLIASGVVSFFRSAATRTLESSTIPRTAGSMARGAP